MDTIKNCKNCGEEVSAKFCSNCGQRKGIGKVTFQETFQDFSDMVFSVNAPLIRTLKLLIVNPGKLLREYLSGKRKEYYKPVPFFILASVLYIILRSLINYDPMEGVGRNGPKNIEGTLLLEAGQFMVANINNIMFLFVFALGLLFKVFFYKKNSLAEYIAISFYTVGIYTLIGTIGMFYFKYVNPTYKMIPIPIFAIYIMYVFTSYFKSKSFLTIVKTIIAYILSFLFYVAFGYGLSFLIVWLKSK